MSALSRRGLFGLLGSAALAPMIPAAVAVGQHVEEVNLYGGITSPLRLRTFHTAEYSRAVLAAWERTILDGDPAGANPLDGLRRVVLKGDA